MLDKKIGLQLGHNMNLKELAELCDQLEAQGNIIEANNIHNLFIKKASEVEKGHSVKFPMTFEQALEKFSPEEFEVDIDGKWEDTEPISDIKNEYEDLLDEVDMFLIMTVEPGFGGQSFMADMMSKVRQTRTLIGDRPIWLQVDGGISLETISIAREAGADTFVAGSAVFNSPDPAEMVRMLRQRASDI